MTGLLIFAAAVLTGRWILGSLGRAYEAIDSYKRLEEQLAAKQEQREETK